MLPTAMEVKFDFWQVAAVFLIYVKTCSERSSRHNQNDEREIISFFAYCRQRDYRLDRFLLAFPQAIDDYEDHYELSRPKVLIISKNPIEITITKPNYKIEKPTVDIDIAAETRVLYI